MDQAELDKIHATIMGGQPVDGWSANVGEVDSVRRVSPDDLWVRRPPAGRWINVPAMGDGASADA